jgi:hypothetical protein
LGQHTNKLQFNPEGQRCEGFRDVKNRGFAISERMKKARFLSH